MFRSDVEPFSHYYGCVARLNDTHSIYGTYSLYIINWDTQEKRYVIPPDGFTVDSYWPLGCGVAHSVNGTQVRANKPRFEWNTYHMQTST
jgi:hypothetical protein